MPFAAAAPAMAGVLAGGSSTAALGAGAGLGTAALGTGAGIGAGAGLSAAGGALLPAVGTGTAATAGGTLLPALGGSAGLALPATATPTLASTLGSGAMNMGNRMLPQLANTMVSNATAPRPPGALPSYQTPDMQTRGGSQGGGAGSGRLTSQDALHLLLGDIADHQQRQQQGYGLRG